MKSNRSLQIKLVEILLGATIVIALAVGGTNAGNEPVHLTTDWSHRHLVFSAPHSLAQHFHLLSNPRYVQQLLRRNAGNRHESDGWRWRRAPEGPDTIQGDWSINMGTGATVGAGNEPAKYSFSEVTASCSDFVVYNTSLTGAAGQATIVAFDNLYVGTGGLCGSGPGPSTYWAFNTGTGDSVVTSPVLSGDGTQVAFVQNNGTTSNLIILRWKASSGTLSTPVAPTAETAANYYNSGAGCTSPCMTTITFSNSGTGNGNSLDSNSSPFYDYATDTIFVGNNLGWIHKFTPVFKGAPAEITATWPLLAATAPLSSPVYDEGSGKVFVNASFAESADSGTRLHSICVTSTCGTIGAGVSSGVMGPVTKSTDTSCSGTGKTSGGTVNLLMDAPILDPTNEVIYSAVGNDGLGNSALYQFSTSFATQTCGNKVTLGTGSTTGVPVYAGNFDNLYYCNGSTTTCSSTGAGHFYVCGNAGGNATLYSVSVPSTGILTAGAGTAGPVLTTAAVGCSPVTEFLNGSTDYIFLSVTNDAVTGGSINCGTASGCLMSFTVTSGAPTATTAHAVETGGTSGIIVDGDSSSTGASQVYFTPLSNQSCATSGTTGGCAIQASQSGLD